MSSHKEYPSLLFVADDLSRCANSLASLYKSSSLSKLSRHERVSLSVIVQKIRSHIATIHSHRIACDKATDLLRQVSLTDKEIEDSLPF